jgi:hypothetical protein
MRKNSEQTTTHTDGALSWSPRTVRLTGVLGAILLLALLHNPGQAFSAILPGTYNVGLAWDRSPDNSVAGYRLYYGGASRNYTNSVVVGNVTTNTVSGLASGIPYFFAVTAYDASGSESDFSNEAISVPGQPGVRIGITPAKQAVLTVTGLIGHTYEVLASTNLTAWTVIGTVTLGASGSVEFTDTNAASFPKRFYRTRDTQP